MPSSCISFSPTHGVKMECNQHRRRRTTYATVILGLFVIDVAGDRLAAGPASAAAAPAAGGDIILCSRQQQSTVVLCGAAGARVVRCLPILSPAHLPEQQAHCGCFTSCACAPWTPGTV